MPIPSPKAGESKDNFVSRCISALAKADPNMPNEQRIAICFSKWRSSKGIKHSEEIKDEEFMDKHEI